MTGAALDVVDPRLPALASLFDQDELSSLFSRPVHVDRVRHKRGVSAVARLRTVNRDAEGATADAEPAPLWLTTYAPGHAAKLNKTLERADALGYRIDVLESADGSALFAGPIGVDMKLHRILRPFAVDGRVEFEPGTVLNYNPHRRVVFRLETSLGTSVCKAGDPGPGLGPWESAFLADLAARGLPVLQRSAPPDVPHGAGLRYYPWFGQGDLQAAASGGADVVGPARAAGAALAGLHAQPLEAARGGGDHRRHDALHELAGVCGRNIRLLPTAAPRLEAIRARIARRLGDDSRRVLSHGDFSADQVLVNQGEVLLADFDRTTTAPPGLDVGGFLASDLLQERVTGRRLRTVFLEGYEAAGGDLQGCDLPAWVAARLFDRLNEPFRACSPDWRTEMVDRLDVLESVLDGGLA